MFQGSMVALVTPMQPDGSIDHESLQRLVDWHIDAGTDAIVAVGTTGESATLDFDEHCMVIARVVEHVKGRLPVIAGTGANATREAIELTRCARDAGADACLLVTPYYNKPTQEGLYRHYRAVAEAVEIPQILYNVPGRTAVDLLPETVERLAGVPNIVGLKEALGSPERTRELVERVGGRLELYSGDDATALDFLLAGGQGVISVTANVAPALMHEMCALALAGDASRAREVNDRLDGLHHALFLEANPIPVKWATARLGLIPEGIRLPLTPLSEPFHAPVLEAMRRAGIALDP
ncbi:4-hydroxy-tetrahydrodipicolinate synthase [Thioalkalivibrio paradoxus]|uniref:4-hydroxy-tetrahydrodipicolinate synthase n=1 Tax=Thioalkalivibrio paradoxus ARh 1 TaxID=713585 RepID=W0DKC5_9GAMM|nr:4-hydroxy-tetrahydrodipicolinate synthase [Thioalkalivibrio paradoxus]AHE97345.1 dihydrodipicolinate synthase [Thioalkalivibrio paradoxus ARh 1]